jgi:hypothetical protein
MLAQADFQRALALALGEFAEAWAIVGECSPIDRFDASHWGSGPQSFQVTLRHRVTGHLKVLGRRVAYEPGASVHPAVALSLIGAYRHGNSEPIRGYFEEIGIAVAGEATSFFQRPSDTRSVRASGADAAEAVPAGLAMASVISEPRAAAAASEAGEPSPGGGTSRPWSLIIRKSKSPAPPGIGAQAPRDVPAAPPPAIRRSARMPPGAEPRTPMLGRLKRELEIWYWRRGASSGPDKEKWHARD